VLGYGCTTNGSVQLYKASHISPPALSDTQPAF
jgi:hypothetical protein